MTTSSKCFSPLLLLLLILTFGSIVHANILIVQLFGRPQWLTVKDRSHSYVNKVGTAGHHCNSIVHGIVTHCSCHLPKMDPFIYIPI